MKKVITLFATVVMIASFSNTVLAQATDNASASARIVTPIAIAKDVDMDFGTVAVQTATGGTVVLLTNGTRTVGAGGGVTLPAASETVTAASFTVSGNGSSTYSISLPVSIFISDGAAHRMTVDAFTSFPLTTGTLSAGGSQTLYVGATLNVKAGQVSGTYTNSAFPVTVNYN